VTDSAVLARQRYPLTYASWLNQVEIWFPKIEREVIACAIFTSVPDLARKLRRYIDAFCQRSPNPVEIL